MCRGRHEIIAMFEDTLCMNIMWLKCGAASITSPKRWAISHYPEVQQIHFLTSFALAFLASFTASQIAGLNPFANRYFVLTLSTWLSLDLS